ncbi:hypothetical protein [Serratia liquefaciens]|uniref:Fimbrial protein n=1 Tax=Serratia liquefaciens TaxID=614 RepID=A0A515D5R1_SERLI|nr:hypothetical protein [Serratia liquefaciens]QDL35725.1 hypothetical protein EGO53_28485 [Serratia liquefaciens]QDL35738.1 hypothetical protein EGO53_28550 [Serratia liquefaciens]
MKSTITKNVTGLLVLASAALPFASQAAEQSATVTITATVDATVALDVAKSFDLTNLKTAQALDIKTTSNGLKVKLEVSQEGAADEHIVLTSDRADNAKMKVKATLGESTNKFVNGVLSVEVPASTAQQTTKLHLTSQPTETQEAGIYTGNIIVKALTL